MRGRAAQQIVRAVRFGPSEAADIADQLYQHKLDVYIGTLEELAAHHGYTVSEAIVLSDEIDQALFDESHLAANQIVSTFNADLGTFVRALPDDMTPEDALKEVQTWTEERAKYKGQTIGVDQAYDAHADATVHFYESAGATDLLYDFGGHGDPDPECELCEALKAANPHPAERVLEIGTPHPGCAQEWHARDVAADVLPATFTLGAGHTAGIVGQQSFLQRHGNQRAKATAAIQAMP